MIQYPDGAIVDGLRLRSDLIIRYIYKEHFPVIKYLVMRNSGNEEDAEDIFQDGLVIIFKKIRARELELTSSFRTYLYSICRNLWLTKLKQQSRYIREFSDIEEFKEVVYGKDQQHDEAEQEKYRLYQTHFHTLGDDCKKLLLLFMKKMPLREIASEMGYKTENYAKTRKYLCKEELKRRIINDPKCQIFLSDDK